MCGDPAAFPRFGKGLESRLRPPCCIRSALVRTINTRGNRVGRRRAPTQGVRYFEDETFENCLTRPHRFLGSSLRRLHLCGYYAFTLRFLRTHRLIIAAFDSVLSSNSSLTWREWLLTTTRRRMSGIGYCMLLPHGTGYRTDRATINRPRLLPLEKHFNYLRRNTF
jgi:hypothetical protein